MKTFPGFFRKDEILVSEIDELAGRSVGHDGHGVVDGARPSQVEGAQAVLVLELPGRVVLHLVRVVPSLNCSSSNDIPFSKTILLPCLSFSYQVLVLEAVDGALLVDVEETLVRVLVLDQVVGDGRVAAVAHRGQHSHEQVVCRLERLRLHYNL